MEMIRYLVLLLVYCTVTVSATQYYYVTVPGEDDPCPSNATCQSLAHYTNQSDYYFTSDTTFYFMKGTHTLATGGLLLIDGVSNISLEAYDGAAAVVSCESSYGGVAFVGCSNVRIVGMSITQCGGYMSDELLAILDDYAPGYRWNYTFNTDTFLTLFLLETIDLSILNTTVYECRGYGLFAFNVYGINIYNSYFTNNNIAGYTSECTVDLSRCYGGNAFIFFTDPNNCSPTEPHNYSINVINCTFSRGVSMSSTSANGGLGIALVYSINIGLDINIISTTLYGNTAPEGANLFILVVDAVPRYTISISGLNSTMANALYPFPTSSSDVVDDTVGGGLYFAKAVLLVSCPNSTRANPYERVTISNSLIANNLAHTGSGGYMALMPREGRGTKVTIDNTTFSSNTGSIGTGLYMAQRGSKGGILEVSVSNVQVRHNVPLERSGSLSAVQLISVDSVMFSGVMITDNAMQGINMFLTTLSFAGRDSYIVNNTGLRAGGAISMKANSVLLFTPPINLYISGNTARIGAALFVESGVVEDTQSLCFFQVNDLSTYNSLERPNATVYIDDNVATSGIGDVLYSTDGGLFRCALSLSAVSNYSRFNNKESVFLELFKYNTTQYAVPISSNAVRVCFCSEDNSLMCNKTTDTSADVFPGEMLPISIVTVGIFQGRTSGLVSVGTMVRRVGPNCTTINVPVTGNTTIEVRVQRSTIEDRNTVLQIIPNILPCPYGFQLSEENGTCECLSLLTRNNVTCDLSSQLFTRASNDWISYDVDEECAIVERCPFDYCNNYQVTFNITSPQAQCAMGRTGYLCGACLEGQSLMLGSNRCGNCSNAYISLIVPFAVAGVALVALLIALNLTVSVGTINGLIFYTNIIKINESTFFPNGPIPVLTQFISWINLDMGIETCFYNGLNSFWKTWLQFLFPIYIGIIVGFIIVLSRRFNVVTRLTGNNAVPVLATLLLLSYTKILRIIIQVLQLGKLQCNGSVLRRVWLFDGTVKYIHSIHASLFVVSLVVFVVLAIPYTLVHLLIPLLEKKSIMYSCCNLKPYFDAQCGPFKDEYRFWGGLLLLARLVLTIVVPFSDDRIDVSISLITVVLIISLAWNLKGVYRNKYLDTLESWFHLNLAFVCVYFLGIGNQIGTIVSISLVLVTFLGILVYHFIMRLVERGCFDRLVEDDGIEEEMARARSLTLSPETVRTGVRRYLTSQRRNQSTRQNIRQRSSIVATARDQYEESWGIQKTARRESMLEETLMSEYNIINNNSPEARPSINSSSPRSTGNSSTTAKRVTYSFIDQEALLRPEHDLQTSEQTSA